MRYFIQLSYHGKNYHGWQVQPNARSVQQCINEALSTILRQDVYVIGAGRTDTGVHARQMWAHFDVEESAPDNLVHKLNSLLDRDIAVQQIAAVSEEAHARFDAVSREYEYRVTTVKDPFEEGLSWHIPFEIDLEKVRQATKFLFDFDDFTSFSKSNTQTHTNVCKIMKAEWQQNGHLITFTIKADRFLRNMVRAITGTLMMVGKGRMEVEEFSEVIKARDRKLAGESAPASGLFLMKVEYPKTIFNGSQCKWESL